MTHATITKFKETEIGTIPEEWEVLDIQTVSEVMGGGTPSTADENNFNGDISWITPRDLSSYPNRYISRGERCISEKGLSLSNAKLLPVNTVLLTTRAPVGYLAIANNEVATNQGFHSLVPNNKTNSLFLFYLLKNNVQKLIDHASGSTFQELNGKTLKSLEFAFPKIDEQKQIAEVLSSLDDKIELNRHINANLEKIASSLFKYWFVDFEFPNKNGKPCKSSGGKMIDSELGEIPEGWRVGKLSDISDITIGRTPPRMQKQWFSENSQDVKWISIRDLGISGVYINKTAEYLTKEAIERFNIPIIPKGTVILSFKLTVGRDAITTENMLSNEAIAHIKLSDKNISQEYIYLMLKKFDFTSLGTTSSIATAVNSKSIKDIPILVPSQNIVRDFTEIIEPLFKHIYNITIQLDNLTQMRDSLLPRLMNGKIRVK